MDATAKISVIIPVYKVESYLCQCLDSVVNQTYKNLEIILIDDGSPDNCGKICDEYAKRDKRIIVIHKENGGLSAARNDGIKRATGEWIAFVDSDDWCDIDYYEELIRRLGNTDVDIFCANGCIMEFKDERSIKRESYTKSFIFQTRDETKKLIIKTLAPGYAYENFSSQFGVGSPWDKIYKKSFICSNNLWFDASCKAWEDFWFNVQAFDKAKCVAGCVCTGYHYRMVDDSIVRGYNPNKPKISYEFIAKLHVYFGEGESDPKVMSAIKARSIMVMNNAMKCYYFHPSNPKKWREIKAELKEMIQWKYFQEAINEKHNPYLSWKQQILKQFLRFSWIGSVKVLYMLNESLKERNMKRGGVKRLTEFKPVISFYTCVPFVLKLQYEGRAA